MADEREVNPAQPDEVEVSETNEVAGAATPSPTNAAEPTALDTTTEEPKRRGRGVDRSALSEDELKKLKRDIDEKSRSKKKAKKEKQANVVTSEIEIKPKEAREILLNERGIRNLQVVDVCVEHAQIAARNLKIPFNRSLLTRGLQGVLAARDKKPLPEFPPDVWNPGNRLREHELHALWDYVASWRAQPDGTSLSFDTWKEYRRRCVTDLIWYGNTVLGKDFQPEPHGKWADELFPKLEPALMSLPEKFTQKDIAEAFHAVSDVRQRCLIAARSSFKSTVSLVFLHQLNLAFGGSIRCVVISATQPLARGFATNFRNTLTLRDPNSPTLMNQLWPEHCIGVDDGKSLEYTSPFRQLDMLIEPTVRSLSLITEGSAGGRYDYACYEDAAEISNSSTPEMRAKTQERVDMLRELGEPHSLTNYVGTPISAGTGSEEDPGDLYSVLLRREEINKKDGGEPKLLYTICPAWTVKSGVRKQPWDSALEESEVDLLFPSRLTFKYLMGKLKENLATDKTAKVFRQQSLVSWVPDEEEGLRVQFGADELRARTKGSGFFGIHPAAQTVMALDRAFTANRYSDFSCCVVGKVQPVEGKMTLVITDCRMERWRESDLVKNVVEMIERHKPSIFVAEQDRGWETLADAIRRECLRRGIPVPYFRWKVIQPTDKVKAKRIKTMELPLSDGRLWFVLSTWTEQLLLQFEKYDGVTKSNNTRKDDGPDACAILWESFGPKYEQEVQPEESKQREEEREKEAALERRNHFNNLMFGNTYTPPPPKIEEEAPQKPADPRDRVFSYGRAVQPSSDHSTLFGAKGRWRR